MHSHACEYYNIAKKEVHPLQRVFITHTEGVEGTVSGSWPGRRPVDTVYVRPNIMNIVIEC